MMVTMKPSHHSGWQVSKFIKSPISWIFPHNSTNFHHPFPPGHCLMLIVHNMWKILERKVITEFIGRLFHSFNQRYWRIWMRRWWYPFFQSNVESTIFGLKSNNETVSYSEISIKRTVLLRILLEFFPKVLLNVPYIWKRLKAKG